MNNRLPQQNCCRTLCAAPDSSSSGECPGGHGIEILNSFGVAGLLPAACSSSSSSSSSERPGPRRACSTHLHAGPLRLRLLGRLLDHLSSETSHLFSRRVYRCSHLQHSQQAARVLAAFSSSLQAPAPQRTFRGSLARPTTRAWPYERSVFLSPSSKFLTITACSSGE